MTTKTAAATIAAEQAWNRALLRSQRANQAMTEARITGTGVDQCAESVALAEALLQATMSTYPTLCTWCHGLSTDIPTVVSNRAAHATVADCVEYETA